MEPRLQNTLSQIIQKASEFDMEHDAILCSMCGRELEVSREQRARLANAPAGVGSTLKCLTCKRDELEAFNADKARREKSLSRIPKLFISTDRNKLPRPEKLDEALKWKFGEKGLLLHGPSGCGKTRIIWEIAKREIGAGRSVRNLNAYELTKYPSMVMDGSAIAFGEDLVNVDLLILDDVFKAKATERIEELLFSVVDERGAWERPCLVSLNDTGETLRERLSSDRGPALIRRFRDYCSEVKF